MVPLAALWLPIIVSAVFVFIASFIMHMVLPYHRGDYGQLPDEDMVLAALRAAAVKRGLYVFPYCTHKDMRSPALIEKQKTGAGRVHDHTSQRATSYAEVSNPMVRVLPRDRIFRRLSHRTHGRARHTISGCLSRRRDGCVPRLRSGKPEQWHLERTDLVVHHKGSNRRARLRFADRRHVRLALAEVEPQVP